MVRWAWLPGRRPSRVTVTGSASAGSCHCFLGSAPQLTSLCAARFPGPTPNLSSLQGSVPFLTNALHQTQLLENWPLPKQLLPQQPTPPGGPGLSGVEHIPTGAPITPSLSRAFSPSQTDSCPAPSPWNCHSTFCL